MEALQQMKDIHLPQEISAWPPAYGWWILSILLISVLLCSIVWLLKYRKRRLAKRQALDELQLISEQTQDWPQQLNRLLKRLAISYFPHTSIATLHAQDWTNFLAQQLPTKKRAEFLQQFLLLQSDLYRKKSENSADFMQCFQQIEAWIKHAIPPKAKPLSPFLAEQASKASGREHV